MAEKHKDIVRRGELLPAAPTGNRLDLWKHPAVRIVLGGLSLIPVAGWLLQNFLQMRGVVSVMGSRLSLYAAAVCLILWIWILARNSKTTRILWPTITSLVILGIAFLLDFETLPHRLQNLNSGGATSQEHSGEDLKSCEAKYLGEHDASELPFQVPPNTIIGLHGGILSEDQKRSSAEKSKEVDRANCRVKYAPEQITLYDLFLTDFAELESGTMVDFGNFNLTNSVTKKSTIVGYEVIDQLGPSTRFLAFYIRPSSETVGLATAISYRYQIALDSWIQKGTFSTQNPGDSEQMTSKTLTFTKRIYIYHETYIPLLDKVKISDSFRARGLSVILRSSDYLTSKRMEYGLKLAKAGQK